jgi:hypothetical protein
MKKLVLKLRNTKGKKVKTAVSIPARFVTSAERGRESMACVDAQFFMRIHAFVDCVVELFHVRWDRTQHEIQTIQLPNTPLEPGGKTFSFQHEHLLAAYEDLQNELLKRRPRLLIDNPINEAPTAKRQPKID